MDAAECVIEARVAEINFGSFDEPFAKIGLPRQKPANHVGLFQGIEIGAGSVRRDPQRGGDFAAVPNLCVIVGEHGPETTHKRG